jgi:GAF domain-containing protein
MDPWPSPPERELDVAEQVLAAIPFAAFVLDLQARVVLVNQPALAAGELSAEHLRGADLITTFFADSDQGAAAEVFGKVFSGETWQGELPVLGPDGAARSMGMFVRPLIDDARVVGAVVIWEDLAGSRAARRLAARLARLARVTAELLFAEDLETVTDVVTGHMADAAGATVASVSLLVGEERLHLIGLRGGRSGAIDRWRTYDVAGTPAGDCVSAGKPLLLSGRAEIQRRYPDLETAADGERSMACLPLLLGGRTIGVVTLSFPGKRPFVAAEVEFFGVMADVCSQAVGRVQTLAAAADQAAKLRFLADATAELASSLDYESTLSHVARLAVPWFADWCSISVGFDGDLRTLAVAHVEPDKVALAREYQERYPQDPDAPQGSYQVFRTGVSEVTPEITEEMLDAFITDPDQRAMIDQLQLRSAMTVPLAVGDRVLGVVTWVAGEGGRRFSTDDLRFGEDLARRAAVAIDNARLHTEVREMAIRLQRAVLPADLPVVPGWEMAAHYSPAGSQEAGGDFYDVIPLDGGRLAFFVGDVMGRGVHAAAAMAQMRSSIRALVAVDPDPSAVLSRLDVVFERYEMDQLVTMVYAVVDPDKDVIALANAGHLPPVLLRSSGATELFPLPDGLLLGAGRTDRVAVTLPFFAGDAVLAFTDGMVERRDEDIDAGLARLVDACERLGDCPLPRVLGQLTAGVSDPVRDDDVAAVLLRRIPARLAAPP